ncbi:MAG: hypothetical protein HDT47_01160 [Ruminococcaceae bacterium]|nr:hypothetical protein [Oscillospiraceae bacterium]
MLLKLSDSQLMGEYLVKIGEHKYRTRDDIDIPNDVRKELLDIDEYYVLYYGEHMIINYKDLKSGNDK